MYRYDQYDHLIVRERIAQYRDQVARRLSGELDEDQFNAAVNLLKEQKKIVGEYWSDAAKQIQSFTSSDSTAGTSGCPTAPFGIDSA